MNSSYLYQIYQDSSEVYRPFPVRQVVLLILVGVLLRVIWATLIEVNPTSDGFAYDVFAKNLITEGVFGWQANDPGVFWPPGTTFLHAAAYQFLGVHYSSIVILNILLFIGIVIVVSRVCYRILGHNISIFAAAILSLWPTLIMFSTILSSELPYIFFTVLGLDIWTGKSRSWWLRGVFAGFALGFASLIRPLALLLPFLYAVVFVLQGRFNLGVFRENLVICCIALVSMTLVIAPWTLRNYKEFDTPILISTNGAITLWMGNNIDTNGSHTSIPDELTSLPHHKVAEVLKVRALEYIQQDYVAFISRGVNKLALLWGNETIGVAWNEKGINTRFGEGSVKPLKWFTRITWWLILALTLTGFYRLCTKLGFFFGVFSLFPMSIMYYSTVHAITVAQDRYHLSFAFEITALAAIGLTFVFERLSKHKQLSSTI